jgi:hypothetical protein
VVKSKLALGLALISGCATLPEGPSITALPGTGKSLEEFRAADDACRQGSLERVRGVMPNLGLTSHDRVPLAPEHESHIKLMSLYVAGGHGQEVAFSLAV